MIRAAQREDYPAIMRMCREFWGHTAYDDPFDSEHVLSMVRISHAHQLLSVLQIDEEICGFVAGISLPLLGNGHVTQVTELAYWIDPDHRGHGLELLSALESSARMIGAKYLNMISMESSQPEVVEKIYERRGFQLIECVYMKEL